MKVLGQVLVKGTQLVCCAVIRRWTRVFQNKVCELASNTEIGLASNFLCQDWLHIAKRAQQVSRCLQGRLGDSKMDQSKDLCWPGSATPLYHKVRSVPFALKEKIEAELERLQKQGIIEPVQFTEWAAPIVPVVKSNESVRICGDHKVSVNRVAKRDKYPLPLIDDLFASLAGGERFTKLDLSQAYQQIELDSTICYYQHQQGVISL